MKKNYILTVCLSLIFSAASFGQYSDLFISMYAEGSSNNKFIEIYNGTGSSVDLSDYMIKGSNNGGDWKVERDLSLTGSIANGDVFVISTDQADASILAVADLALAYESPLHYNGDDAIAIFKKNMGGTFEVLDIIGVPTVDPGTAWDVAGTTNATQNHTLTRKNSVSGPSTDWTTSAGTDVASSEWVVTAQDSEWASLGSYSGTGTASVKANPIEGFAMYPNPSNLGYVNVSSKNSATMSVSVFDVIGKQVINGDIINNRLNISQLKTGIYILKAQQGNAVTTKKLVIQ